MKTIDISAPAGGWDSLAAALRAGADSVYFGVGQLNMRSGAAANFTIDDLDEVARKCRRANVTPRLALNTIVHDDEIDEINRILAAAQTAGINTVIAADLAVMRQARKRRMETHVSVQANVSNLEAVKHYAQFADVMILARELTLPRIRHIIETINAEPILGPSGDPVKIELFAHGALCVAVSGKCLMSLALHDASANRGECRQPCRRAYQVTDLHTGDELVIDNQFVMSPKDICVIGFLDQLLDAGVSVLKIEGRGRPPEYVRVTVETYREAIDAWRSGTFSADKVEQWRERLRSVFNRGFWKGGYYLGESMGEWCGANGNQSPIHKIHIGEVARYYPKLRVAELILKADGASVGQTLLISGRTTGAVTCQIRELRDDGGPVEFAEKGTVVSVPVPEKVRPGDIAYRLERRPFGATSQ